MTNSIRFLKSNKALFARFFISLIVTVLLATAFFRLSAYAQADTTAQTAAPAQTTGAVIEDVGNDTDASLLQEIIGVDGSQPLEVILLLTVIALAPSMLIMMTCFTRIIIVFSFLRNAMATNQTPPNMVLTGLALFLTIFIMAPVFADINEIAYQPYVNEEITLEEAVDKASVPLKEFMLKQTSNDDLNFFLDLSKTEKPAEGYTIDEIKEDLGLHIIVPSFVVSELKRAFQMGFLLFLPFLVIDLVVASTLMSMGMMMLPPAMISLPFKIMVFVLVDGWQLIIGTLIASYN